MQSFGGRLFVGCVIVLIVAVAAIGYSPEAGSRPVALSCDDFISQEQAQEFFHSAGGPWHDRHGLDQDRNGIACEHLV